MKRRKSRKKFISVVWAEGLSEPDLKKLRSEVKLALSNPNHALVTNYELNWDDVEVDANPNAVMVASAPSLSEKDTEAFIAEVERAQKDPNYVIVANYPVYIRFVNNIR
jgi:hypothetical protein